MSDERKDRCDTCINSRVVVSENGYHSICTLSSKAAINCMTEKTDSYYTIASKKKEED
jgi:hypothetical protein